MYEFSCTYIRVTDSSFLILSLLDSVSPPPHHKRTVCMALQRVCVFVHCGLSRIFINYQSELRRRFVWAIRNKFQYNQRRILHSIRLQTEQITLN